MLLRKKYIFENSNTKALRYFINSFLTVIGVVFIYALLCFSFIVIADNETKNSQSFFYKRPPDLIVVFTGDVGRIKFAMKKAKEYKQAQILISGVYSGNTVTSLFSADTQNEELKLYEKIDQPLLELDYLAKNTVENVIKTLRYIQEHNHIKSILIISHDYHILRIRTLINAFADAKMGTDFHYMGLESDYFNFRNLKILFKESFKLLRAIGIIIFWDTEVS